MSSKEVRTRRLTGVETDVFHAARFISARALPYMAAAVFAMSPVAAEGLDTFGVDHHWRLYMDPECLRDWSVHEIAAVLLHEAGHLVRDHAGRGEHLGLRTPQDLHRWNLAGDLAINDDLVADGQLLPGTPALPEQFGFRRGMTEEAYFTQLTNSHLDAVTLPRTVQLGDCGSGADGQPRKWELGADGEGHIPVVSRSQAAAIRRRVSTAMRQAGHVRGESCRHAEHPGTGRSDWRQLLRAAVAEPRSWRTGQLETSWSRPDRRQDAHPGLVLPGRRTPRVEIAVILDTSASMGQPEIDAVVAEVSTIQRQCAQQHLWQISCDTEPSTPRRVGSVEHIELRGGGGTDLRPAIALLGKLRPRPDIVIVLTDGHTPWPDHPPRRIAMVVATTDKPCTTSGVRSVHVAVTGT